MKAVVCHQGHLSVENYREPVPGQRQVLLKVRRCGICGSDLHARKDGDSMSDLLSRHLAYKTFMRANDRVVMGHEFSGEVLDYGPGAQKKFKPGTPVVALPFVRTGKDFDISGLAERRSGGMAERTVVEENFMLRIPNGLSFDKAAMVEPLSVAWHAVRRAQIKPKDVAIVIGCGPVGLGVITMLEAAGVRNIVASDFSAVRRTLAERCGATMTIDPAKDSPYKSWKEFGHLVAVNDALVMASEAVDMLGKIPGLPWWHAWHLAEKLGATDPKRPIVFECVGAPGILQRILEGAPMYSRVVVAGVCMAQDAIQPSLAINKEIELRFVFGYTPVEFRDTLHMIAEGKVDPTPLHTGTVGLEGVEAAFDLLGKAEGHAKILIDPESTVREPVAPVH